MGQSTQLYLSSEADTKRLAACFAAHMAVADVVLLNGGLAAGKTFFVAAAAAALGSTVAVTSPTYTIANIYPAPFGPIVHIDAYRLENASEFEDLALEDLLETGVAFIEWGAGLADEFDTWVSLELLPDPAKAGARHAVLAASGQRGKTMLAQVLAAFQGAKA